MPHDSPFQLEAPFLPAGDQPQAVAELVRGLGTGDARLTLEGVTGSGKTFTLANVIRAWGRPTLVLSHNKTLAAQLFAELKGFFPHNAVEFFISYYDYYQPEAYLPTRDLYIEKDSAINDEIDRLRHKATSSLLERRDVIVVASVSCIYGLGDPDDYKNLMVSLRPGMTKSREEVIEDLVRIQYIRNDFDLKRGTFRVRGDILDIFPASEESTLTRVQFFGDEIEEIREVDAISGRSITGRNYVAIFPARHFVTPEDRIERVVADIEAELIERLDELRRQGKTAEMQRLEARTRYDMELLSEVGFCPGIENYARHISGRKPGERPACLLDYFPEDFLTIVDESHQTVPQIRSMHHGDRSRKQTLVDYGFRLPSAMDNRPLTFDEWEQMAPRVLFVSATPERYEVHRSGGRVVDQIIRPTGLVDPVVDVRPARGQVQDVIREVRARAERGERTLVTTLTKRLAEDLSDFLREEGLNGCYLHSEVQTIERVEILNDLRRGKYDVIVGVNLLREGLDLPEVSLVAVLDADREGFLRSDTSLIQTMGRCARNVNAVVILYADRITESMARAMEETQRRREKQMAFNEAHGIVPQTIRKSIQPGIDSEVQAWKRRIETPVVAEETADYVTAHRLDELEKEMDEAAARLDFERAALLRDRLRALRGQS